MKSLALRALKPAVLWLAFSLSLALAGCQPANPAATAPATPAATLAEKPAIENQAPAFSLPASDGSTVSLSDFAGQPVLLYFHMANG